MVAIGKHSVKMIERQLTTVYDVNGQSLSLMIVTNIGNIDHTIHYVVLLLLVIT